MILPTEPIASEENPPAVQPLIEAFRARPALSSTSHGWHHLSAFVWHTNIADYRVSPTIGEVIVALHTEGVVDRVSEGGRCLDRSIPGRVSLLPARAGGSYRSSGTVRMTTLHLHNERLRGLLPEEFAFERLVHCPIRFGIEDSLIASSIRALVDEIRCPSEYGGLYADALSDSLVLHLLRADGSLAPRPARRTGLSPRALRIVRDRIDAGLAEDLSLDDLAGAVGLSRCHFARSFKQATGTSPHQFLTLRRIEKAKALLESRNLPLAMIALDVGFSSQSRFCESFRRITGITPRQYQKLA
jgi:AraC family transcriptional regulator